MLEPIDFDAYFERYLHAWMHAHPEQSDADALQDRISDLYVRWLREPNEGLGGVAPIDAYRGEELGDLVALFPRYCADGGAPPDPLMEALEDYGAAGCLRLLDLADEVDSGCMDAQDTAMVEAIGEMVLGRDLPQAQPYYWRWIQAQQHREDVRAHLAVQALCETGDAATGERALAAMREAPAGLNREAYAEIVATLAPQGAAKALLCALEQGENIPFYAHMLSKLYDGEAIEGMKRILAQRELGYLDFLAIRDALEVFGEFIDIHRDFAGDPEYDALVRIGLAEQAREADEGDPPLDE